MCNVINFLASNEPLFAKYISSNIFYDIELNGHISFPGHIKFYIFALETNAEEGLGRY